MRNTGIEYTSAERTPTILPELAELLPPLSGEQLAALEKDILQNGCYAPIIVNEDLVVVDGHNRQQICTRHDLPYKMAVFAFDDLLEATKSAPVQVSYTSNLHEMLARKIVAATEADLDTVYYSSTSDAITDLLGGFIPVALGDIASYSSYVTSGQLRVLASCSDDRWPVAEDVPTLVEMGYEGAAMSSYLGLAVPKGTDPAIVSYLSDLVYQVASDPTFQDRLFEVTKLQSLAYTGEEIKAIFEQVYDEAAEIYGPID